MKQGTEGFVGWTTRGPDGRHGQGRVPARPGAEDVDRPRNRPRGEGPAPPRPAGPGPTAYAVSTRTANRPFRCPGGPSSGPPYAGRSSPRCAPPW
ncbi:hypothetical protein ACR6C2_37295 [Streptomyces sp. INA 01156]